MSKYIYNGHTALIRLKVDTEEVSAYPLVRDNFTGGYVHTGYTAITEAIATALESGKSGVFNSFAKMDKMRIVDNLPAELQTTEDILREKDAQISDTQTKLDACEKSLEEKDKYLEEMKKTYEDNLASLRAELDTALEKISKLENGSSAEEPKEEAKKPKSKTKAK